MRADLTVTPVLPVPAIVLAAGGSSRLGRPKQLEELHGETLLERAVRLAVEAGCAPVVVLGCAAERIQAQCKLQPARVIFNPDWQSGMASSVRAGLRAVQTQAPGAVIMTCDQPAVTADHLRTLVLRGSRASCAVASAYAQRRGVPAYFPADCFPQLLELEGDTGAREILRTAEPVDLAGGELDVDTEELLEQARRLPRNFAG